MAKTPWYKNLPPSVFGEEQMQGPESPIRAGGYTGRGPDGIVQANNIAPTIGMQDKTVHENEVIMDSRATNNLGVDTLESLRRASHVGAVDKQKLMSSIQPAYRMGGKHPSYKGGGKHPSYSGGGVYTGSESGTYPGSQDGIPDTTDTNTLGGNDAMDDTYPDDSLQLSGSNDTQNNQPDNQTIQTTSPRSRSNLELFRDYQTGRIDRDELYSQMSARGIEDSQIDAYIERQTGRSPSPRSRSNLELFRDYQTGRIDRDELYSQMSARGIEDSQIDAYIERQTGRSPYPVGVETTEPLYTADDIIEPPSHTIDPGPGEPDPTDPEPTGDASLDPEDMLNGIGMEAAEKGLDGILSIAEGGSAAVKQIEKNALQEFGGIMAQDLGAFQQDLIAQGYTPEQAKTMTMLRGRDVKMHTSKMIQDFAQKNKMSAEKAMKDLVTYGLQVDKHEIYVERFGADMTNQMYSEVASMDRDSFIQKYGDEVGTDEAGRIYDTARVPYDQANEAGAVAISNAQLQYDNLLKDTEYNDLTSAINQAVGMGVADWENDPALKAKMQEAYETLAPEGLTFDEWADNMWLGANTTMMDAEKNRLESNNPIVQDLISTDSGSEAWEDMWAQLELHTALGGTYKMSKNPETGEIGFALFDDSGNLVAGNDFTFADSEMVDLSQEFLTRNADYFQSEFGEEHGIDSGRVSNWLRDIGWEPGEQVPAADEFIEWHRDAPDLEIVSDYMQGRGAELGGNEEKYLSEIASIQERILNGDTVSDSDRAKVAGMPTIYTADNTLQHGELSSVNWQYLEWGYGRWYGAAKAPGNYYGTLKTDLKNGGFKQFFYNEEGEIIDENYFKNSGTFKIQPSARKDIESKKGGIITLNGTRYLIDEQTPIITVAAFDDEIDSGKDPKQVTYMFEVPNLIDLETGEPLDDDQIQEVMSINASAKG